MARKEQDITTNFAQVNDASDMTTGPRQLDDVDVTDAELSRMNLQEVLEGSDASQLDLQKLEAYIELLQAKASQYESLKVKQAPFRHQTLYRLSRGEYVHRRGEKKWETRYVSFFDHPQWIRGQGNASQIQCNLPLDNFELYLEKNKDIAFIVYENFDTSTERTIVKPQIDGTDDGSAPNLPQKQSENIRPVNTDLIEAIKALLGSQPEYAEVLISFSASYELSAPYLYIYHSRKSLEHFQNNLPLHAREQLSLLIKYVTQQYADEYATADAQLSQGRISPDLIHYLFKPGDLLISRVGGQHMAYVSNSWPKLQWNKKVSRNRASTFQKAVGLPLYGSEAAEKRMGTDMIVIHGGDINAWHWEFDGNFQRKYDTLSLQIQTPEMPGRKNGSRGITGQCEKQECDAGQQKISDLNVFPLQFAPAEIIDTCRRRGKTFWKCRIRGYVSYQDNDRENIQNLVSLSILARARLTSATGRRTIHD